MELTELVVAHPAVPVHHDHQQPVRHQVLQLAGELELLVPRRAQRRLLDVALLLLATDGELEIRVRLAVEVGRLEPRCALEAHGEHALLPQPRRVDRPRRDERRLADAGPARRLRRPSRRRRRPPRRRRRPAAVRRHRRPAGGRPRDGKGERALRRQRLDKLERIRCCSTSRLTCTWPSSSSLVRRSQSITPSSSPCATRSCSLPPNSIVSFQLGASVAFCTRLCFSFPPTPTLTYGSDLPLRSAALSSDALLRCTVAYPPAASAPGRAPARILSKRVICPPP